MVLFHVEMLQLEVALHFCVTVVEPREVARIHVRAGQTVIRPFLREIRSMILARCAGLNW